MDTKYFSLMKLSSVTVTVSSRLGDFLLVFLDINEVKKKVKLVLFSLILILLLLENIICIPNMISWAKLHVPGLVRAGSEVRENHYAEFPYYSKSNDQITQHDDIVAMAVVIMEGLWADANRRDDWRNHISMP